VAHRGRLVQRLHPVLTPVHRRRTDLHQEGAVAVRDLLKQVKGGPPTQRRGALGHQRPEVQQPGLLRGDHEGEVRTQTERRLGGVGVGHLGDAGPHAGVEVVEVGVPLLGDLVAGAGKPQGIVADEADLLQRFLQTRAYLAAQVAGLLGGDGDPAGVGPAITVTDDLCQRCSSRAAGPADFRQLGDQPLRLVLQCPRRLAGLPPIPAASAPACAKVEGRVGRPGPSQLGPWPGTARGRRRRAGLQVARRLAREEGISSRERCSCSR
jgi:hypothetical protein